MPWDCKYAVIDKYVKMAGATVFVESGTCHGNTPARLEDKFDQLHTIEVDTALYEGACARFKDHPKIKVWKGDSAVVLPEVLKQINETCLFWLDGHYSGPGTGLAETGECPVVQELDAIYRHPVKNHVILIDDAWSFGVIKGYPAPEEIERMAASKDPTVRMETNVQRLSTGLLAGMNLITNRFTGPGRLGIQSMYLHLGSGD